MLLKFAFSPLTCEKIRVSDAHYFFADPDLDHGGIRGVKGKNYFLFVFFSFQMILNSFLKKGLSPIADLMPEVGG